MKIIAFCNIQFICHLLHEKSLTLPNWFCPSFFPPRGPQILCKIWPAISAYLHFTPVEEKNCVSETREFAGLESLLFIRTTIPASLLPFSGRANKHCRQKWCPVESPHFQNSKHRLCKQSDGGLNTVLATSCNGYFETNKQTFCWRFPILFSDYFQDSAVRIKTKWKMLWKEKTSSWSAASPRLSPELRELSTGSGARLTSTTTWP